MDQKAVLEKAIQALNQEEPGIGVRNIAGSSDWALYVNGVEVCQLSEAERHPIMSPLQNYRGLDQEKMKELYFNMISDTKAFLERRLVSLNQQ